MYQKFLVLIALLLTDYDPVVSYKYTRKCQESVTSVDPNSKLFTKKHYCSGDLIFNDEFDDFSTDVWDHVITEVDPGNLHFEWYVNSRENTFSRNGVLHVRPTADFTMQERMTKYFEYWNLPYNSYYTQNIVRSARINTKKSFSFRYGRVEVIAKLPSGDWLWPAIWMMPTDNVYGNWPISGEIDLMESRGNRRLLHSGKNIGNVAMGATLHFGPDRKHDPWQKAHYERNSNDLATEFHNYTVVWTPTGIAFYLDQDHMGTVTPPQGGFYELGNFAADVKNPWTGRPRNAPFDQYFHMILNVAVGGNTFFPDNCQNANYEKPWKNTDSNAKEKFMAARNLWTPTWRYLDSNGEDVAMQVDSVKIYAI